MPAGPDPSPALPDALDAVVAAPLHHRVLLDNDDVRVLDTLVAPGDTVPLHAHPWPSVIYIQTWSDFVRRDPQGVVLMDSRQHGAPATEAAFWSPPLSPHTLENVGPGELRALTVEIKR